MRINLLIVHQVLVDSQTIYGKWFSESTAVTATTFSRYNNPETFSLPVSGYRIFHTIITLVWNRDPDITNYHTYIKFYFIPTSLTTIDIQADFGVKGTLHFYTIGLLLISESLFESTPRKNLMCSYYANPTVFTPSPIYSVTIPFPHEILGKSYFVGFRHLHILTMAIHFSITFSLGTTGILRSNQYSTGSGVDF